MEDKGRTERRALALATLATRQHGIVSAGQLRALGYSTTAISKAAARGRLHRVHRRVYAVGHRDLTWEGRCLAAVLANAPALASHGTAAWLWGLLRTRPTRFQLTAPTRRRQKPEFEVHYADLGAGDRALRDGLPVTSVPRTLLDLAAGPPNRLEQLLQRAEEERLLDLRTLEDLLSRRSHHPGARALRQALETYRPQTAFTRSDLEKRFLALVTAAGLPAPRMNFVVGRFEMEVLSSGQGGTGETRVCDLASAGPSGARTQGGRIAALFGRLRTPHREASVGARRGAKFARLSLTSCWRCRSRSAGRRA